MDRLLIKNIGLLQTPEGSFSHKGEAQGQNLKLKDAAIYAEDGIIKKITSDGKLPEEAEDVIRGFDNGDPACNVIDAEGNSLFEYGDDRLCMYTCANGWQNIFYVQWQTDGSRPLHQYESFSD